MALLGLLWTGNEISFPSSSLCPLSVPSSLSLFIPSSFPSSLPAAFCRRGELRRALTALAAELEGFRATLEGVQDYAAVRGLALWHQEYAALVRSGFASINLKSCWSQMLQCQKTSAAFVARFAAGVCCRGHVYRPYHWMVCRKRHGCNLKGVTLVRSTRTAFIPALTSCSLGSLIHGVGCGGCPACKIAARI